MKKKVLLLVVSALVIVVSSIGYLLKLGHLAETGWESSSYPFWLTAIVFGALYCLHLGLNKKMHPFSHPVLWFVGVVPIAYGLFVGFMMGGFW